MQLLMDVRGLVALVCIRRLSLGNVIQVLVFERTRKHPKE